MRHKGYTLIEILIVLALFSLFISISVPGLGLLNRTREANEIKEFKRDLLYTRNKAIVDRKSYKFNLDYDNNGYSIVGIKLDDAPIKSYKFQYGVKLLRNPDLIEYTFSKYGTPSKSETISFKDSRNNKYEIAVAPATGKITLRKVN